MLFPLINLYQWLLFIVFLPRKLHSFESDFTKVKSISSVVLEKRFKLMKLVPDIVFIIVKEMYN